MTEARSPIDVKHLPTRWRCHLNVCRTINSTELTTCRELACLHKRCDECLSETHDDPEDSTSREIFDNRTHRLDAVGPIRNQRNTPGPLFETREAFTTTAATPLGTRSGTPTQRKFWTTEELNKRDPKNHPINPIHAYYKQQSEAADERERLYKASTTPLDRAHAESEFERIRNIGRESSLGLFPPTSPIVQTAPSQFLRSTPEKRRIDTQLPRNVPWGLMGAFQRAQVDAETATVNGQEMDLDHQGEGEDKEGDSDIDMQSEFSE